MTVCSTDRNALAIQISRSSFAQQVMDSLRSEVSDLMQDSTRIDRWLTIDQEGRMRLTTRNTREPQVEIKFTESYDPESNDSEEDVRGCLLESITELLIDREYTLLSADNNRTLRTASADEVLESWMSSPGGAISTDEGTSYVAFSR